MVDVPKRMGRPRIEFGPAEWQQLDAMAQIHCTRDEMAGVLGVSADTLEARIREEFDQTFAAWFERASAGGKASLRRMQWKKAKDGNVAMMIWLGKQYLGQRDQVVQGGDPNAPLISRVEWHVVDPKAGDAV